MQDRREGYSHVRIPQEANQTACMHIDIEPLVLLSSTGPRADQVMRCEKDRQRRTSSHAFRLVLSPHVLVAMMTVEHLLGEIPAEEDSIYMGANPSRGSSSPACAAVDTSHFSYRILAARLHGAMTGHRRRERRCRVIVLD